MSLISFIFIAALPILALIGMGVFALYSLVTETLHRGELKRHYNHPDKDMPLYNVGHCDEYSAGVFTW